MKILSIVIPAREEEAHIKETVEQFATLTLPHEIIVSDGNSSDDTVAVAESVPGTIVVRGTGKQVAGAQRNAGAQVATGAYIAFIDSGVQIPDPEAFFSRALDHFKNGRVVAVCGPQRAFAEIETWADRLSFGYLNMLIRFQNNILHKGEANGKFMLVRRSAWEATRGLREDIHTREDGDFFYRLSRIGTTVFDPTLTVYHAARRAHQIGWTRLWYIWTVNTIYFAFTNKSLAKDWTPIR